MNKFSLIDNKEYSVVKQIVLVDFIQMTDILNVIINT